MHTHFDFRRRGGGQWDRDTGKGGKGPVERRSSDDSDSGDGDSGDAADTKKRRKKGEDEGDWVPDEMDEVGFSQDRDKSYLADIKAVLGSEKYKVRMSA